MSVEKTYTLQTRHDDKDVTLILQFSNVPKEASNNVETVQLKIDGLPSLDDSTRTAALSRTMGPTFAAMELKNELVFKRIRPFMIPSTSEDYLGNGSDTMRLEPRIDIDKVMQYIGATPSKKVRVSDTVLLNPDQIQK